MADTSPPQTGLIASSDYVLRAIYILTSTGSAIEISPIMLELDLFESVFSPCMTGQVLVGDGGDMISSLQLHGNEFISIVVDKPSLNKPIQKTFRIYKISDRTVGPNALQNYRIYFCSEEMLLSTQRILSRSYKGLPITTMVKSILKNDLSVSDKKMGGLFSASVGNFDLIIPKMQPLQAIEWMAPKAYTGNGNLFFFFENRDGYNFVSYEDLISLPAYASYSRVMKVDNDPAKNILGYNHLMVLEDFDIIKATRMGAFNSTLLTVDIVNRSAAKTNINWANPNRKFLNDSIPINDLKNRFGQTLADPPESMLKYIISADSDPTFNPAQMENWVPQTIARLGQLNAFKAVMIIPGDVLLKSGAVVNVVFPQMEIQQSGSSKNAALRTGNYLVTKVHHNFKLDTMTTIVELMTDSVAGSVMASSSDPGLKKMVQA